MKGNVRDQIRHLSTAPGTYIFKDTEGNVLYVGKARNLRSRVRQYFTGSQQHRTALFVPLIESVETIVAGTEKEALLLESTLIKRYRPPFNVDLKDDKSYPSFCVTVQEEYPRITITRNLARDNSLYFGPFTDAGAARKTLAWLEKAFPLRRCKGRTPGGRGRPGRPCLDFQMGRCLGPCEGEVTPERYAQIVQELIAFLQGKGTGVLRALRRQMEEAAGDQRYEEAAALRDRIAAVSTVLEKQDVVGDPGEDMDVLGFAGDGPTGILTCLFIRSGMIVGRADKVVRGAADPGHSLEAFLAGHYREGVSIPPRILTPQTIEFGPVYEEILTEMAGRKVSISRPTRGRGRRLVALADQNAGHTLRETLARDLEAGSLSAEVKKNLHLTTVPERIECIDISHTSGQYTYGSTVVWEKGRFVKDHYRLYKVRGPTAGGDDLAALAEVMQRRFSGSSAREMPLPDLFLVDGGKGQLSRASHVLVAEGVKGVHVASISKAAASRRAGKGEFTDEIHVPGRSNPIRMPRSSKSLQLLQMLRDEAHRFALASHRKTRGKGDLMSRLDGIEGVGPVRRKALLNRFRSVDEIRAAPVEDIAGLRGFNMSLARRIKEGLG